MTDTVEERQEIGAIVTDRLQKKKKKPVIKYEWLDQFWVGNNNIVLHELIFREGSL